MADKTRVLVLYHSSYGHIEKLASAVAEGARSEADVEVTVKRVPRPRSPYPSSLRHGGQMRAHGRRAPTCGMSSRSASAATCWSLTGAGAV